MTREEAIKVAIEMYGWLKTDREREALETLIPELSESNDERIRKYLIEELKAAKSVGELKFIIPQPTREECIAYLEKQKQSFKQISDSVIWDSGLRTGIELGKEEQKSEQYDIDVLEKHITKDSISELAHTVIVRNGWEIVEKEQKPIECIEFENEFEKQVSHLLASVLNGEWEYDEGFVKHAAQSLLGYAKHELKPAEIDEYEIIKKHIKDNVLSSEVNKRLKECGWYVTGEKPAVATINGEPIPTENQSIDIPLVEWNEEDGKRIQRICNFLWKNRKGDTDTIYQIEKDADWLESLPERFVLQSKQEWSEEYEKVYSFVYDFFENCWWNETWDISRELVLKTLKSLRHSWKPTEKQKYDGNMDKECIKLCDVLNSIQSIDTFESCCGHLKDRYSIWFFCNDIITISRLGRCVERNYSDGKWELLLDSTDTHPTGVFWLRSKVPFQSYDEMEESVNWLCNCIQYWFNTKFDSYFNNDLQNHFSQ